MKIVIYFTYTGHTKMIAEKIREKLGCEYSRNGKIQSKHLKSAFIVTAWNNDEMVMSGIDKHIDILIDYLNLENMGKILAKGYGYPGASSEAKYINDAYNLGKSLK